MKDGGKVSLAYKPMTDAELKEISQNWPRCFICGGWAQGTNRTNDMWACGPHWATSLSEALALKGIHERTHENHI